MTTDTPPTGPWTPTRVRRFIKAFATSTAVVHVQTDDGLAYLKALGNPQGPHALACDLVGTRLARWFGLQTFDHAIMDIDIDDEIPFKVAGRAVPGPAFVTRAEMGRAWTGHVDDLLVVDNALDVAKLVAFDTWVRNCDRHAPGGNRRPNLDNVFLSEERVSPGRFRLVAMDHGHAFTCGRDLVRANTATIELVRDEQVFGLFPEFRAFATQSALRDALTGLSAAQEAGVREIVESIPAPWEVSADAREALVTLVLDRAAFLSTDPEATAARLLRR